jgi:hypothetical protein
MQMSLDFARGQRDAGMTRALDNADKKNEGWSVLAYSFLLSFARTHQHFISEDVSGASKEAMLPQPPTDRAWGSVYRKAMKNGIIIQSGMGRSARRHASVCPRWESRIYVAR